jgi:hypothetical protein
MSNLPVLYRGLTNSFEFTGIVLDIFITSTVSSLIVLYIKLSDDPDCTFCIVSTCTPVSTSLNELCSSSTELLFPRIIHFPLKDEI